MASKTKNKQPAPKPHEAKKAQAAAEHASRQADTRLGQVDFEATLKKALAGPQEADEIGDAFEGRE